MPTGKHNSPRGRSKHFATSHHKTAIAAAAKREGREPPEHIVQSKTYEAWSKTIELVEDIWDEYQHAKSAKVQKIAVISEIQDRLLKALKTALPYEKPRLQTIKLQGDKDAPLFDLSTLSDKELEFLRKTVLKANQIEEK